MFAGVGRLVDSRFRTVSDAEQPRGLAVQRFDISKIQFLGARNLPNLPCLTSVNGAKERPLRSARPRDVPVYRADAAEIGPRLSYLRLPLGLTGKTASRDIAAKQDRHRVRSPPVHVHSCGLIAPVGLPRQFERSDNASP